MKADFVTSISLSDSVGRALEISLRGADELLPQDEWVRKLQRSEATGTPLRIKLGLDPTAPDIHIGHTVVLNKMRQLQDLGHTVIFLIGDFTTTIGDPSGRNSTRPPLTREQIEANAQTYYRPGQPGARPVDTTEIRYNSEWSDPLGARGMIQLAAKYTVARMMERDDFSKRFKAGQSISVHEFLYPLMQGYDSVALKSDLELGGTDQKFNLLVGRHLQQEYGQEPQCILTMPLLEGLDGVEKMSKSKNNYIGISEDAEHHVRQGAVDLRRPDVALVHAAELPVAGRDRGAQGRGRGRPQPEGRQGRAGQGNHRALPQRRGGRGGRAGLHQPQQGRRARRDSGGGAVRRSAGHRPAAQAGRPGALDLEGNRLIDGGGVRVDSAVVSDKALKLPAGSYVVQVGKRKFAQRDPELSRPACCASAPRWSRGGCAARRPRRPSGTARSRSPRPTASMRPAGKSRRSTKSCRTSCARRRDRWSLRARRCRPVSVWPVTTISPPLRARAAARASFMVTLRCAA